MKYKILITILCVFLLIGFASAEKPNRVGTTTANFLEIGYGSAGNAMGDAAICTVTDLSAMYWNPARLAYLQQSEAQFSYQPWIADINSSFSSVGLVVPSVGTLALGLYQMNYGDMKVTTMDLQDGTGEYFTANDLCLNFSFGRKLASWFAFGASGKYITSKIWHSTASAVAVDLGMVVDTYFFSPTGNREDGLTIGMSISNYGTKMQFEGMDLMQPIDLFPNENGNYEYAEGEFKTQGWELPLIFRIGMAINPIVTTAQKLTVEINALHPNNNSESVNIGAQYQLNAPSFGSLFLRGGYKALFMEDSEYGPTFGAGLKYSMMNNLAFRIDYAYRDIGVLGSTHSYTFSFVF